MIKFLSFILLSAIILSCNNLESKENTNKKITDGIVKQYRAGNILKNEITLKDGKKNGIAKDYYKDGKIHQQLTYVNDVKHGEAITYYETGKIYQSTPYVNGKISGIRKKFRQNGILMAEIPYYNDLPCKGLKEYLLDGSLKKGYPKIIVEATDNILKNGNYKLRFKISDKSKKVDYFPGLELSPKGCFNEKMRPSPTSIKGVMDLTYNLPTGAFLMQEVIMTAIVTTKLGNPLVITIKHNLALENRGF